jgi:hypothetical protein
MRRPISSCLSVLPSDIINVLHRYGDGAGSILKVLNKAIQPPPEKTVTSALQSLQELNALSDTEALTPLGMHLARLPVANVRIGMRDLTLTPLFHDALIVI